MITRRVIICIAETEDVIRTDTVIRLSQFVSSTILSFLMKRIGALPRKIQFEMLDDGNGVRRSCFRTVTREHRINLT